VPDIGDFDEVEVIEVLVNTGDELSADDSIITLESDKASMEIPAVDTDWSKVCGAGVIAVVVSDDSVITFESDNASMEIPTPFAGIVTEIKVTLGDKIKQDDIIVSCQCLCFQY
jgi:pyruvate/2-oxoglutarate dehydrogenase complex dihydrolipoamide acyltransferase (E2) component